MGFSLFVIIYILLSVEVVARYSKVTDKAHEPSEERCVDEEPAVAGKRRFPLL
jgi:hypothetical protein